MEGSAPIFFDLLDQHLRFGTEAVVRRVFSTGRDLPWTPQQRAIVRLLVQRELDRLLEMILGIFDTPGAHLPGGVAGWIIVDDTTEADIRVRRPDGTEGGYAEMWLDYLHSKGRLVPPGEPTLARAQRRSGNHLGRQGG